MRYFTAEEAAKLLNYTVDQIYALMQPGRPGAMLAPAYVVGTPLDARDKTSGKSCKVPSGVYEVSSFITYVNGVKRIAGSACFDKDGFAYFNELTSYEPYEQPAHISMGLYPVEGNNRRRDLARGKPEITEGCEEAATREEIEYASKPKSWMDKHTPEELAPIEEVGEANGRNPLVVWEKEEDKGELGRCDLSPKEAAWISEEMKRNIWPSTVSFVNGFGVEFICWKGGWMYARNYVLVGDPITITKKQLVILDWTLEAYMQVNGMTVPEELEAPFLFEADSKPIPEEFNPEVVVKRCRQKGMCSKLIAHELDKKAEAAGRALSNKEIGHLLPDPKWGDDPKKWPITEAAISKRGERLRKSGKETVK